MSLRLCLTVAIVMLSAASARADARAYRGPHPIDEDGNWHFDESVHVHDELPVGLEPFGDIDGLLVFLGDPLEYGYEGEVWTFRGAHPLPGGVSGYCGLAGEHRHHFAPEGEFRRTSEGAYVFTGAMHGGRPTVRPGRTAPAQPMVVAYTLPLLPFDSYYPLGGCWNCNPFVGARAPVGRHRVHGAHSTRPPPRPAEPPRYSTQSLSAPVTAPARIRERRRK